MHFVTSIRIFLHRARPISRRHVSPRRARRRAAPSSVGPRRLPSSAPLGSLRSLVASVFFVMSAFEELGVCPELIRVADGEGWLLPTPVQVRSIHWSPYDRVRVVNADP